MRDDVQPLGDLAETLGRLLRNTVFRLSLIGSLLFGLSLLVAQVLVYREIVLSEQNRIENGLVDDLAELEVRFVESGSKAIEAAQRAGLLPPAGQPLDAQQQLILKRIDKVAGEQLSQIILVRDFPEDIYYSLFVFKDIAVGRLANEDTTLEALLTDSPWAFEGDGTLRRSIITSRMAPETDEIEDRRVLTLGRNIFDAQNRKVGIIVVGRDVENIMRTGERMRAAMTTSSLIAVLLGVLSSIYVARRFARRVDALNKLANDVQAGNLDRRAPRNYSEDEMDRLAEHLNGMLDHIDRLMQAMRYAGDSVAHDLRTPLTRLRTRLESAAVEAGDSPEADVLYAAAGDAQELLGTFDSVLRIARLEAGERRELLKPLDPKPILDDLAELYEPACEDVGLVFTHDIADGLTIMADRGRLSQAVSNLVENAIKYAGGGGGTRIHLAATKGPRGRVRISVADDGPGIPKFERERVKERFVRLDKSRTLPGSGLGLALVEAVAELHQAEFNMDDGLGAQAVEQGGDHEGRPGLLSELVFPKVKASRRSDAQSGAPTRAAVTIN